VAIVPATTAEAATAAVTIQRIRFMRVLRKRERWGGADARDPPPDGGGAKVRDITVAGLGDLIPRT
jgi:hypothetical protein